MAEATRDLDAMLDTLVRLHGRARVEERLAHVAKVRRGRRSPAKVIEDLRRFAEPSDIDKARARRARKRD